MVPNLLLVRKDATSSQADSLAANDHRVEKGALTEKHTMTSRTTNDLRDLPLRLEGGTRHGSRRDRDHIKRWVNTPGQNALRTNVIGARREDTCVVRVSKSPVRRHNGSGGARAMCARRGAKILSARYTFRRVPKLGLPGAAGSCSARPTGACRAACAPARRAQEGRAAPRALEGRCSVDFTSWPCAWWCSPA